MGDQFAQIYEFGPFRIDVRERILLHDGKSVPLTPKAFDTLLVLVESDGQVVEHWGGPHCQDGVGLTH